MTLDMLFQPYIPEAELSGNVLKFRVTYKSRVNAKNLTPIAFTFWQIMVTNVLPKGGHLNDVSSFRVYLQRMYTSRQLINLHIFIIGHI